jgi:mono/diheme cytochrome c family protein
MKRILSLALIAPLALLLISCSLAADVTPPPGYKTPVPQPTDPPLTGPLYPAEPPSPARGAVIYAGKCASCHGESGLGDGPDAAQLRDQNIQVPPLGLPEFARLGAPDRWYAMVTQGNLKRFMPPFRSLSDAQRWDVVAYALSLSATPADLEAGQALYETNCAKCHTEGDVLFIDQARMAKLTSAMMVDTISAGKGKMPAFADLNETQLAQLVAYVRSLSFADSALTSPHATALPEAAVTPVAADTGEVITGTGLISGTVTNLGGASIPAGLTVTLYVFDQFDPHPILAFTQTTQTTADGSFRFADVSWKTGQVIGAAVEYQNVLYGSQAADVTGSESTIFLPIEAYETSQDTSALVVDRHHVIFTFDTPGVVSVMEMYAISNPTPKTVAAVEMGQPVVYFPLPSGAENLQLQSGELGVRYLSTPDGFADTEPVYPGSGAYQVSFQYTLPYQDRLDFSQPVNLNTTVMTVLVPEGGLQVSGNGLVDGGVFQGMPYHRYDAADLAPDAVVAFSITGQPETAAAATTPTDATHSNARRDLAIGLGALGAVLVALGVWFYQRTRSAATQVVGDEAELTPESEPALEDADTLMDAIIALDDQHRTGQIPEDAYLRRRAELKAQLQKALAK